MAEQSADQQAANQAYAHLTPQQRLALATSKNVSVTAGAGSGKTTILVERYLKIVLEENVDVRKVLAITFTDKAAAEMTERVARKITQMLNQPVSQVRRTKLLNLRERLNSAQISTIHSFCARLLREFAVASGVDPDFSTLNAYQQRFLKDEAIEEVVRSLDEQVLESAYDWEEWRNLLRQVPINVLKDIFDTALGNAYEFGQLQKHLSDHTDDELLADQQEAFFQELDLRVPLASILSEIRPQLYELTGLTLDLDALKPKGHDLIEAANAVIKFENNDERNPQYLQKLLDLSALLLTSGNTAVKSPSAFGLKKNLHEAYQLIPELSEAVFPLARFGKQCFSAVPGELDMLHIQALRKIIFLCEKVAEKYNAKKEERGLLDFDDLQLRTLYMLESNPKVCETLRTRYRHVMVDEFQDTNQLQWDIISRLGMIDGQLQKGKFFVVGDPKQSIYGFRGADVRVFKNVKQDFAAGNPHFDGNIVLEDSFRFLPTINHFINTLYEKILVPDPHNEFEVNYDHLNTLRNAEDQSHVQAALLDKATLKEQKLGQEDFIASQIHELLSGKHQVFHRGADGEVWERVRPGDIAILIPRRTRLLALEAKLREQGIPFKTIGGIGFYQRQEIFDVYHLLRFLSNPSDDLALISLLRSPFASISDAALYRLSQQRVPGKKGPPTYIQRLQAAGNFDNYPDVDQNALRIFRGQLQRWQQRRDRLSLSRLLDEIFDESFYRATVAAEWNGEQLLANLDKVITQAREYEQGGFIALSDFIESLHQLIMQDPREGEAQIALEDENTVKIMTIHQSKGLEFPIVFCPYLDQKATGDTSKIRFEADLGLGIKIRDPNDNYREKKPFLFEFIDFRLRQKQTAEDKRLYYVAVTRARDQIYLVGATTDKTIFQETALGWTLQALNVDPEFHDGDELVVDESLTIALSKSIEPSDSIAEGYADIETSIDTLNQVLADDAEHAIPVVMRPLTSHPSGVTFSATQLMTFAKDEQQYFDRYHLGFFESDYEFLKQLGDADSISLLKGKIVHKVLEDDLPRTSSELENRLEQAYFQYEVFDEAIRKDLDDEVPQLVDKFSKSDYAAALYSSPESKSELSITMQLGTDFFTGTLDRMFLNQNGHWEVLDYKTNHISGGQVEKTGQKYDMQMKAYALLLSALFPNQNTYPITLYFLHPGAAYQKNFSAKDIAAIETDFLELVSRIKAYYPFGSKQD